MARKSATVDSDEVFVCISTYMTPDANGTPVVLREGARHRGSSGFPRRHPQMWVVADEADDQSIARAKQALDRDAWEAEQARTPKPAVDPEECVTLYATRTTSVRWVGGDGHPRTIVIREGEAFAKNNPLVKANSHLFRESDA